MERGFYALYDEEEILDALDKTNIPGTDICAGSFLAGHCDLFACALNKITGLPIEMVKCAGILVHAYCVEEKNGRELYYDIRGCTDSYDTLMRFFDGCDCSLSYPLNTTLPITRHSVLEDSDNRIVRASAEEILEKYRTLFYDPNDSEAENLPDTEKLLDAAKKAIDSFSIYKKRKEPGMEDRVIVMEEEGGIPQINTFINSNVSDEEAMGRANLIYQRELALFKKNHKEYEHIDPATGVEYWTSRIEKMKRTHMSVMTHSEFKEKEKEAYLSRPMREITEEEFNYYMNILPPLHWVTKNGVEEFCMREMFSSTFTNQYARAGNKYYAKYVDAADETTWIDQTLKSERVKKMPKGYDRHAKPIQKTR